MEYTKKNWHKNSFYDFNNYGYFQFASVKNTFENKKTLPEVLAEMGIEGANLSNNTIMHYDVINKETNDKILYDAINNIHEWGLVFPTTYHKYTNNPYNSYFKGGKRYLYKITSLFDFDLSD